MSYYSVKNQLIHIIVNAIVSMTVVILSMIIADFHQINEYWIELLN